MNYESLWLPNMSVPLHWETSNDKTKGVIRWILMIAPSFGFVNKNSFRSFFGQKSFSKVLILLFSTKKMTFKVLTLERSRHHCTRTFSTIWALINFYFFRRTQTKYTPTFWSFRWWSVFYFSLSRSIPLLHPKYDQKSFFSQNWLSKVQQRSLSKIVHIFVIFILKSQFRFWPLPLKMNSTVKKFCIKTFSIVPTL